MRYNQILKLFIVLFVGIHLSTIAYGQDAAQYNHYIANQGLLNPAYNGTRDVISGILINRNQWIGLDGAPMNQSLNIHGPIEDTNLGVGFVIMNDIIGFSRNTDAMVSAAYKLEIDRRSFISLGLQLGVSSIVYDGTKAVTDDYRDPVFEGKQSKIGLNVGFGAYLFKEDYFAGFSIPKMFSNSFDDASDAFKNTLDFKNMPMYLYGGYVFDWGDVKVKPTLLFREVYGAPLQFDVSGNVLLMETLWLGLSYRSISDVVFLAEFKPNPKSPYTFRYSFDYSLNSLNQYAKVGSHEISIQFDFSFNKRAGMRSIRYF